jgi:hypothetical protein
MSNAWIFFSLILPPFGATHETLTSEFGFRQVDGHDKSLLVRFVDTPPVPKLRITAILEQGGLALLTMEGRSSTTAVGRLLSQEQRCTKVSDGTWSCFRIPLRQPYHGKMCRGRLVIAAKRSELDRPLALVLCDP